LALELVLHAGVSFRGAAATLAVCARHGYLEDPTPAASTIRAWLLRVGCARLSCSLPQDRPWAWLMDHTLQIGAHKLLVIAGCPLDAVPFGQRSLGLADLTVIALVPMTASNQQRIDAELEKAVARTGVPRQILCDGAQDLHQGIERFRERHPQTRAVTDVAHHVANLLKHYWDKDPRWQEFTRRMHQTAAVIRQSQAAYLLAPKLRNKARFMSVGTFVRFGTYLVRRLRASVPCAAVVTHYAWVAEFATELAAWQEQHVLVQVTLQNVRVEGWHARSVAELERDWQELPLSSHPTTTALRQRLVGYARRASAGLCPGERLLASTEVLESAFGVQKRLARDQVESGLTGLTLALGVVLGQHTAATVAADLKAVPQKRAEGWARRWLGKTVQWLRRQFLGEPPAVPVSQPQPVPNPG
jgi:hypothetical protein